MTASPAQIANDMDAWARAYEKSDRRVADLCRDAAKAIRNQTSGMRLDGRTWGGLMHRFEKVIGGRNYNPERRLHVSLHRAEMCLRDLREAT